MVREVPLPDLSPETRAYLSRSDPAHRKALGQFFTPMPLREAILDRLDLGPTPRILDPACGTGEFLLSARQRWPGADLEGWEIDRRVAKVARSLVPEARIRGQDALSATPRPRYDAVIGNPPYFEFKPESDVRQRFRDAISGRVNIYALFVHLGIEFLRPEGRLAFVVSTSMMNGAFFRSLRAFVLEQCAVESLEVVRDADAFEGVQQPVMLLVLRKGARDRGRHVFHRNGHTLLAERPDDLATLFTGRTTLAELGYDVRTGTIVWNQHRDALTENASGAVRLIWSHDIGDGRLLEPGTRADRPAFVRGAKKMCTGPAIVVNRITGSGSRARLRTAVVPRGMPFVGENHVNVILPPTDPRREVTDREIHRVALALRSPDAVAAARLITGNTQISMTELRDLIPVPRA
jgi:adenine-specific DNA-methyltransferase